MSLPDECQPGRSFDVYYGDGNPHNRLWHVRAIVDGLAVCRTWSRNKQYWRYDCLEPAYFHAFRSHIKWRL